MHTIVGFRPQSLVSVFPPFDCDNDKVAALLGGKWVGRGALIRKLVGIDSRHVPPFTADGFPDSAYMQYSEFNLALSAARKSMQQSGYQPCDIGAIVYVSGTIGALQHEGMRMVLNAPALILHRELGFPPETRAITVDQACSGFLEAIILYSEWLMSLRTKGRVLIIGSNGGWDLADRDLYKEFPASFMVFGSGASALILETNLNGSDFVEVRGTCRFTDSRLNQTLISVRPDLKSSKYAFAIESEAVQAGYVSGIIRVFRILQGMRSESERVSWYLAHQPNAVLFEKLVVAMKNEFGIDATQMPSIVREAGNVSGVCVPATLRKMYDDGLVQSGAWISCGAIGQGALSGIDLFVM